jgi:hypothetical protein
MLKRVEKDVIFIEARCRKRGVTEDQIQEAKDVAMVFAYDNAYPTINVYIEVLDFIDVCMIKGATYRPALSLASARLNRIDIKKDPYDD